MRDNFWSVWWKKLSSWLHISRTRQIRTELPPPTGSSNRPFLHLLGQFEIRQPGTEWSELSSQQNKRLLAYFAYYSPRKIRRDKVIADFWPHVSQEAARNSFNVALCHLRRYFRRQSGRKDKIILHQSGSYLLNPDWPIDSDVHQFQQNVQLGNQMEIARRPNTAFAAFRRAAQLYRGDFLEEFPCEEWTLNIRDSLREQYFQVLDKLGRYYLQENRVEKALATYQRMLAGDPCLESGHRYVMWCYLRLGQRDRAIRQYQRCRQVLSEELQAPPSQRTEKLYRQILSGEKPELRLLTS